MRKRKCEGSKITAKTDKRGKRKATKAFTEIEKEELDVLRSVVAATQEQTNRDISDLLGKYMATKMRKLNQMLDEDAIEAAEDNKVTVLMKARKNPVLFKHGTIIINWKIFQYKEEIHLI